MNINRLSEVSDNSGWHIDDMDANHPSQWIFLWKSETSGGWLAVPKGGIFPKWSCIRRGNVLEYRGNRL
jgi:hypothetical protein